jgi:hypothetical protein
VFAGRDYLVQRAAKKRRGKGVEVGNPVSSWLLVVASITRRLWPGVLSISTWQIGPQ